MANIIGSPIGKEKLSSKETVCVRWAGANLPTAYNLGVVTFFLEEGATRQTIFLLDNYE